MSNTDQNYQYVLLFANETTGKAQPAQCTEDGELLIYQNSADVLPPVSTTKRDGNYIPPALVVNENNLADNLHTDENASLYVMSV